MTRKSMIKAGYLYLTIEGHEYRTYVEESGEGIPVLLVHTAGTDGRQYRHLLEDADLTSRFRFIAPDLPYHGKSLPPTSKEWWKEEYTLTLDFLFEFMDALQSAFDLDRPVYMGCSMGGHLAIDLAIGQPEKYRAVIGLEAGLNTTSSAPKELRDLFKRPTLSNETKSAVMYTFMAPNSPEALKRETSFIYGQGSHRVFSGDLEYYGGEHNVAETARTIDTNQVAVYLLGGEYDWSGTPTIVEALHKEIDGSHYTLMKNLGHFPMAENPELFKEYLLPVLDDIAARLY